MPTLPPKLCGHAGCGAVTSARFCPAHEPATPPAWRTTRTSSSRRGYGKEWRRLRRLVLSRDPICTECKRRVSSQVDHIVPKAAGGRDTLANLRGVCRACHAVKSANDGNDGRRRRTGAVTPRTGGHGSRTRAG